MGDYLCDEESCLSSLRSDPGDITAAFRLGSIYHVQGRTADALLCYNHVIANNPKHAGAHCNLGGLLVMSGYLDNAEASLRESIRLAPGYAAAHNNLGVVLFWKGDDVGAESSFREALTSSPENPAWRQNLAMCLLRRGEIVRGCREHEPMWAQEVRSVSDGRPMWDGSPLDGRTILIHGNAGIGDVIQWVRFASAPGLRSGQVIVECQRSLTRFVKTCRGVSLAIAKGDERPEYDVQAPFMALLGITRTTFDTIPAHVPYLCPDPDRVSYWRVRLDEMSRGFRVGIHWRGQSDNARDRDRSLPIASFASLAKVPGVTLINLQRGPGFEQLHDCQFPVVDFGDEVDPGLKTFDDTPALIANLDLVISADTCVAHTAGALGVPVWIALSYSADWRWFRDRSDSPWYPTARLFRQQRPGDWPGIFSDIEAALKGQV